MQHTQRSLMSTPLTKVSRILAVKTPALVASLFALTIPLWAHGQQTNPCANPAPPPGALSLGYARLVFCETPAVSDIDFSATGTSSKLYAWGWYNAAPASKSLFSMTGQTFV